MYEITKKWLCLNNIKYDKLIINSTDKLTICKENKINYFIDDNYETCNKIYQTTGIKVMLYTTKYNKNINVDFIRVFSWRKILKYIIKKEKQ